MVRSGKLLANLSLEEEVTTIKRRIQIGRNLYFEYEVSPHRGILARISGVTGNDVSEADSQGKASHEALSRSSSREMPLDRMQATAGMHVPFKQVRLKGQINPLKPPLHVEAVLIGRALGQQTGYLAGVGFRIRDDGYVEGEFMHGAEKFLSFGDFKKAVKSRLKENSDNSD
jgi:hypothetical protein